MTLARSERADMVVTDIRMPEIDGVEARQGSPAALTDRGRQIVALVAEGLSNDDIAGRLFLSPLTAKTHVNQAMMKLGAGDRAQLVAKAYQSGLILHDPARALQVVQRPGAPCAEPAVSGRRPG